MDTDLDDEFYPEAEIDPEEPEEDPEEHDDAEE